MLVGPYVLRDRPDPHAASPALAATAPARVRRCGARARAAGRARLWSPPAGLGVPVASPRRGDGPRDCGQREPLPEPAAGEDRRQQLYGGGGAGGLREVPRRCDPGGSGAGRIVVRRTGRARGPAQGPARVAGRRSPASRFADGRRHVARRCRRSGGCVRDACGCRDRRCRSTRHRLAARDPREPGGDPPNQPGAVARGPRGVAQLAGDHRAAHQPSRRCGAAADPPLDPGRTGIRQRAPRPPRGSHLLQRAERDGGYVQPDGGGAAGAARSTRASGLHGLADRYPEIARCSRTARGTRWTGPSGRANESPC